MSKPQDKVFTTLLHQLRRDLPQEPQTRLVNLAAVAVGGPAQQEPANGANWDSPARGRDPGHSQEACPALSQEPQRGC